ncbi:MAG: efflux RND transporter periplasmic adaptor subunit [Lachnospiraceae bacterium]
MDNQEELKNVEGTEPKEDIDAQLQALLDAEPVGKKKKKREHKYLRRMKERWNTWSKKRKIITVCGGVVLLWLAGSGLFGGGENTAMPVAVMPLAKGDITEKLSINGPVSGTDSVDVVSNLHTEVLDILVKEGDQVKKDQLLAVLDSSDLQKEVDIAQNAYDLAVSTYKEQQIAAENGYAKAKQDYDAAKLNYDRLSALAQAGAVSQLEVETAKNAMDDANRQLTAFTLVDGKAVANESYRLQIRNAEFTLEQKKEDLANTQITSPIDGTVVRVYSKVGRFADKTENEMPMFVIENLENLEMEISVSEYSIGKVAVGQGVVISADILNGETVQGEVISISPTGEEKGGGSTERVIPTTIRIIDKNSKLMAGITAKAEITLAEAKDTFVIPVSALKQQADGTQCIFSVAGDTLHAIPVETGVESDVSIEIKAVEGAELTEGTKIVTSVNELMAEGMKVLPQGI